MEQKTEITKSIGDHINTIVTLLQSKRSLAFLNVADLVYLSNRLSDAQRLLDQMIYKKGHEINVK